MTAIEKVLLRKDAAALIVAIVIGTSLTYFLGGLITPAVSLVTFSDQFQGPAPVSDIMMQSAASFVLQLVALELLIRLVSLVRGRLYKKG